ncbi:UDP-N-acetylenolpyruvoylglucosamine reductase [Rubidibacter lacunae KORDI 51-2]|uniref:UDP-N-acetylenolpyruvoylglucosamine reductase n=1 Tax=Rubidibacter lacunae KORDI 51-2 TaxID=582515 RepID=U5DJU8_9CHRO|nr:UDP-N-acetylmuramate dehydrogenase [Rubidibacter lacunae]ERN41177.1 UDP-N-acetylenolpyruvoylglucosamine reductase [Rubidibacter lacunae KORDI 51-2]
MPDFLPGTQCPLRSRVDLAEFTSYRVGGPAAWFVAPRTSLELQASVDWARQRGEPLTVLGAGSNLLVSDRGVHGLTVATRYLRSLEIEREPGRLTAAAGMPLATAAWKAAKRGWSGLEWAVGIPGTVGGAVVMNAGAHRACLAGVLSEALVLAPNGRVERVTPADLEFGYRTSKLQSDSRLVLQATLQLQPDCDREVVLAGSRANLNHRRATQPYHLPSCGSVFRNPELNSAGWLIEQLGLKGHRIGAAEVAHRHANFIVNCGGATAGDIYHLIRHVQDAVERHWSVMLHPEVKLIGEF